MKILPATQTRPRKVLFQQNAMDQRIVMLGEFGMSTKYICHETGATPCQVTYRLALAGIRRKDYRDGNNAAAEILANKQNRIYREVEEVVLSALKKKGLK